MQHGKACTRCQRSLPENNFKRNPAMRSGLDSWCDDCHRAAVRTGQAKYKDRYNQRRRGSMLLRRGAVEAINGNPDLASYLAAVALDPCVYCGAQATQLDHIVAIKNEGTSTVDNLASACRSCNQSKSAMSLLGFLLKRRIRSEIALLDTQRAACA